MRNTALLIHSNFAQTEDGVIDLDQCKSTIRLNS